MKPRVADDATAIALAAALHLGLALLLWFAMRPPTTERAEAGGMAADVVDVGQLSSAMQRTLRNRPEPVDPLPEPVPEPEPVQKTPPPAPQPEVPEPDPVEQEAVVDTPTPLKATTPTVQDEKRRAQPTPQAATTPPAPTRVDTPRVAEKSIAEQIAAIRQRRAAAAREALAAEERLTQLTAASDSGSAAQAAARSDAAASGGGDDGLLGRYASALQEAIRAKWTRPDNIPPGALCRLEIRQLPGGEVVDVQVSSPCAYDEQGRRSIEAAVLKAQPLPYAGFEKVFSRTLTLNFKAP